MWASTLDSPLGPLRLVCNDDALLGRILRHSGDWLNAAQHFVAVLRVAAPPELHEEVTRELKELVREHEADGLRVNGLEEVLKHHDVDPLVSGNRL